MGIRKFGTVTPAGPRRSPSRWVGVPESQAIQPTAHDLLTAGIGAQGRMADLETYATTLARASGGRLARVGGALLQLQRIYGNRHVQHVIDSARQTAGPLTAPSLQAKLVVGPADDSDEREADRVAGHVTHPPAAQQRQREDKHTSGVRAGPNSRHPSGRATGVPDDIQRATHAPGRSLPASVKEQLETELGADFGAVRVHTGDQAAQLSGDLQAQAFTHGPNIFFGAGRYAPGTAAGRRLLAHELTHVVQQGGAPPRGTPVVRAPGGSAAPGRSAGLIQRKLSWEGTRWDKAESAWASKEGTFGVVFVTDRPNDKPVVVKTGEEAPAEVVLAANLHPRRKGGKWSAHAPGVRTVAPTEGRLIKQEVGQRVLKSRPGLQNTSGRALKIIDKADQPGTMVFEYAPGTEFKDLLEQGRPLQAKDSPLSFFKDEGFVTSLGRVAAIDIFTGNYDRLAASNMNPENFKIYKKKILLIDNVYAKEPASAFKSASADPQGATSFATWARKPWTEMLRLADFGELADAIIRSIQTGMQLTIRLKTLADIEPGDKNAIEDTLKRTKDWLIRGLKEGRDYLPEAVKNLGRLTEGIAPENVEEVQVSIMERMHFLFPDLFGAELERRDLERRGRRFALVESEGPEPVVTASRVRQRAFGRGMQGFVRPQ